MHATPWSWRSPQRRWLRRSRGLTSSVLAGRCIASARAGWARSVVLAGERFPLQERRSHGSFPGPSWLGNDSPFRKLARKLPLSPV